MLRPVVGLALFAWACAGAAAPRLDSLSVQVLSGKASDVVISVSIERPSLLDLTCGATIDTGDGGQIPITWNLGDSRTKTARYEYKRPGTYRVRVRGAGNEACVGQKETSLTIGAPGTPGHAAATPRCPAGWILVEDSVKGPRYACRARPPAQPLRCAEGTIYFADGGEIGCR
ncbi:MAG TPA: PKD domain-containing protein [Burkholderiales bacterium]|nr:PKD domain-containing protein [Burkholderiales bacterium]